MDSNTYKTQLQIVDEILRKQPLTMLQVAMITGIYRANVCRYIRNLRKLQKVAIVKKDFCPISFHCAGFYSTNPALFPDNNQMELFNEKK